MSNLNRLKLELYFQKSGRFYPLAEQSLAEL